MNPADLDRVFGRGRLKMVTGAHVEVYREEALPGERRRYTKRFLVTPAGDFRHWTEREWHILARLVGHRISAVPEIVQFDRGGADRPAIVQTYDAGITVDHWATLLPMARNGAVLPHVFADCAHWWALARHCLIALDAIHELQLVHLDLKADNVCIPTAPTDFDPHAPDAVLYPLFDQLTLIDFAFSLVSGENLVSALPIARQLDYEYQSPRLLHALEEGRRGNLAATWQLDWRCDFFSLAAMLRRYLPATGLAATWTAERYAQARALVQCLLDIHDAECPAQRPHRALIESTSHATSDPELIASLQHGWRLAVGDVAVGRDCPTPVTRIAPLIEANVQDHGFMAAAGSAERAGVVMRPRRFARAGRVALIAGLAAAAAVGVPILGEPWLALERYRHQDDGQVAPAAAAAQPAPAAASAAAGVAAAAAPSEPAELATPAPPAAIAAPAAQPSARTQMADAPKTTQATPREGAGTKPGAAPRARAPGTAPAPLAAKAPAAAAVASKRGTPTAVPTSAPMSAPMSASVRWMAELDASIARARASPAAPAAAPTASALKPVVPWLRDSSAAAAAPTRAPAPVALPSPNPAAARQPAATAMPGDAAPPPDAVRATAPPEPRDYSARAVGLMTSDVPRVAQRAERQVMRVLYIATQLGDVYREEDIRQAARDIRLTPRDPLTELDVDSLAARRLNEAARTAFWRRGSVDEALSLQTRAFAANPTDSEIVGNLAHFRLSQRPAQADAARLLALHALATHDARHPTGRIEDWTTFAIASSLTGRGSDARDAWLVTLVLAPNPDRQCRVAIDAYATHGERLRGPVEAMLNKAQASGRSGQSPSCEWPPRWAAASRSR